jgi:hypothetical protein
MGSQQGDVLVPFYGEDTSDEDPFTSLESGPSENEDGCHDMESSHDEDS